MNMYNKEQNDGSMDNLLKFVGQKPEKNKTAHSKNCRHHYQLPRKRYITESNKLIQHIFNQA